MVESLAAIGCTVAEIAAFCGCSKDTLERRYAALIQKGRENMKLSVRRMQYQSAQGGNVTMQIWLGKQYLGQSDRNDITSGGDPIKEVRWSLVPASNNGGAANQTAAG